VYDTANAFLDVEACEEMDCEKTRERRVYIVSCETNRNDAERVKQNLIRQSATCGDKGGGAWDEAKVFLITYTRNFIENFTAVDLYCFV